MPPATGPTSTSTSRTGPLKSWLDQRFALTSRGTAVRTELVAGCTSFLAAAYLLVVIPGLLAGGGMDRAAVTTGVIIAMTLGTAAMGLYANLPLLVGPGIGGSVILGVTLVGTEHMRWQAGLGIACLSGLLFLLLTVLGARQLVMRMIPPSIKLGLGASIGLFIAVLGFRNAGMVTINPHNQAYALGDFSQPGPLIALIGLAVAIVLQSRRLPGAMLLAMIVATVAGIPLGVTQPPAHFIALPHSPMPVSGQLDLASALGVAALPYLFVFFASEFFSTLGTTLAVAGKAGLLDAQGNLPQVNRPFLVDSLAATGGPLVGVPGMTALVESAAGAEAGGRSGLTALVAAALVALMLLFVPLALAVPKAATAPALILIGISMFGSIRKVPLEHFEDGFPAMLMVLLTLLSNSFGTGIAGGLLVHVAVKLLAGRGREVPWGLYVLCLPLLYYFHTVVGAH